MATTDDYGQGVNIASLTDAPDAGKLAKDLANTLAQRGVMRFSSASTRGATLTAPVEGMPSWLQDANRLDIYDGTAWRPVLVGGATVANAQQTTITTSSITFVTVGDDCAVSWTAPSTGRVLIHTTARMINSSVNGTLLSPQTRTGSVIGSGTIVEDATDNNSASHYGNAFARLTATHLLTGLTPGAAYNTRLLMRCSVTDQVATFAFREVIVQPAP